MVPLGISKLKSHGEGLPKSLMSWFGARLIQNGSKQGDNFPTDEAVNQLPEDFLIRGQIWSQSYFPPHFFEDIREGDGRRFIEQSSLDVERIYRCLWLGARIASVGSWRALQCGEVETLTTRS
jgi:hypothetical protein